MTHVSFLAGRRNRWTTDNIILYLAGSWPRTLSPVKDNRRCFDSLRSLRMTGHAEWYNFKRPGTYRRKILEHFHCFCTIEFVVSHPFDKDTRSRSFESLRSLRMDGARNFLTPSVKMQ